MLGDISDVVTIFLRLDGMKLSDVDMLAVHSIAYLPGESRSGWDEPDSQRNR